MKTQNTILSILALTLAMSVNALADQSQKVLTVTGDKQTADVDLLVGDAGVSGMSVVSAKGTDTFTNDQIAAGVVVYKKQGLNVLLLKGTVDARTQEGTFTMSFLKNAITQSYGSCNFLLRKDATGYYVENAYTHAKPVTNLDVVNNALGVDTIKGICP